MPALRSQPPGLRRVRAETGEPERHHRRETTAAPASDRRLAERRVIPGHAGRAGVARWERLTLGPSMLGQMPSFGSHGGDDHDVVTREGEVQRVLARDVNEADRPAFQKELDRAAPYARSRATRARVNLAMLYLANGDLAKLREARALADHDWRDLLVVAEYPSTPPLGTEETPSQKASRQRHDRDAITRWRNRPGPPHTR